VGIVDAEEKHWFNLRFADIKETAQGSNHIFFREEFSDRPSQFEALLPYPKTSESD
jgi:hypothetical protein